MASMGVPSRKGAALLSGSSSSLPSSVGLSASQARYRVVWDVKGPQAV